VFCSFGWVFWVLWGLRFVCLVGLVFCGLVFGLFWFAALLVGYLELFVDCLVFSMLCIDYCLLGFLFGV